MVNAEDILGFWFGEPPDPRRNPASTQYRQAWFEKNDAFDTQIRERFLATHEAAAAGQLQSWADEPRSALALLLLLDQFPRNLFRGTPRAFATDARACAVARHALARGLDASLPRLWRWFIYLPFEHSESLADQRLCVSLFETLVLQDASQQDGLLYARKHLEVIERFGRFPHRNAVLGRESTPEEVEFLKQPGSSF
jgi:uncharacterized protein (DUF924 family)